MIKYRLTPDEIECLLHGTSNDASSSSEDSGVVAEQTTSEEAEALTTPPNTAAAQSATQGDALVALASAVVDRHRSQLTAQPVFDDASQAAADQSDVNGESTQKNEVVEGSTRPQAKDPSEAKSTEVPTRKPVGTEITPEKSEPSPPTVAARKSPSHRLPSPTMHVVRPKPTINVQSDKPLNAEKQIELTEHQLREFQSIHEVFADKLSMAFSQKLRCDVNVRLTQVSQPSYGEFVFGLDNPTCFQVIDMTPFPARQVIELHPSILFPLIDRMLGGGKHLGPIVRRPLTAIERRLVARMTGTALEQLVKSWQPMAIVEPTVERVHANPKLARSSNPSVAVCAFEFEIDLGFARGPMRLAYDAQILGAIGGNLAGEVEKPFGFERLPESVEPKQELRDVAVVVGSIVDADFDPASLSIDDVILTNTDDTDLAEVFVDGTAAFSAQFGVADGRKGFRLEKRLAETVAKAA